MSRGRVASGRSRDRSAGVTYGSMRIAELAAPSRPRLTRRPAHCEHDTNVR